MIKPLKNGFGDCLLHSRLLGLNQVIPNEVTRQHTQTHAHTHTCVCVCMYAIYIYIYIYIVQSTMPVCPPHYLSGTMIIILRKHNHKSSSLLKPKL